MVFCSKMNQTTHFCFFFKIHCDHRFFLLLRFSQNQNSFNVMPCFEGFLLPLYCLIETKNRYLGLKLLGSGLSGCPQMYNPLVGIWSSILLVCPRYEFDQFALTITKSVKIAMFMSNFGLKFEKAENRIKPLPVFLQFSAKKLP